MTDSRFQAALDKITGSIMIPQELMARGIYHETVESLRLAARHAEMEKVAGEMARALGLASSIINIGKFPVTSDAVNEALASYLKTKEAGG